MAEKLLFRVSLRVPGSLVDHLESLLEEAGLDDYSSWEQVGEDDVDLIFYTKDPDSAKSTRDVLRALLAEDDGCKAVRIDTDSIDDEDWASVWKQFFHAAKVSGRVVVGPSWEEWDGNPGMITVVIDPGMSFGTGLHPTTRSCIGFIDGIADVCAGGSLFDAGCGSGILSICAAKLGFKRIAGIDIDPQAVECAKANMALNGVMGVDLKAAPLEDVAVTKPYDTVVVNILEPVIRANAQLIARLVASGGHIILSGLLAAQFGGVAELFESLGHERIDTRKEGEWTSGIFRAR